MKPVRPMERLAAAALRGVGSLLDRLPLRRARGFARALSRAYLVAGGRRVRWAQQNLRIAFPSWSEADRAQISLESTANVVLNLIDLRRSERWNQEQLLSRFSFEGLEHLGAAMSSGRGPLLLSLHMGCYDLGLRALSLRLPGLRIAAVSRAQNSALLQHWLSERRNADAVEIVAPGPGAALRAVRILRSGRPLILLNDLYTHVGRRVQVPLFERRCYTSTAPAVLARSAAASILPCYVIRDAPDHHTLRILPELELPDGATADREQTVTAICNTALEGIIRKHPEHWTWAHRRFRYSPDLPGGIYRPRAPRVTDLTPDPGGQGAVRDRSEHRQATTRSNRRRARGR